MSRQLAAEDREVIWPRLMRLRRICFTKIGLSSGECWCRGANADGTDISCTQARDATAFDLLGKPDFSALSAAERQTLANAEFERGTGVKVWSINLRQSYRWTDAVNEGT